MSMEKYDAIVIGAGPAGGAAALRFAREGCRVLLAEKREAIGSPVRCAEATGSRREIERFVRVREEWIMCDIDGARIHGPGGALAYRSWPGAGVVLHRGRFDAGLAGEAAAAGAEVRCACEAIGLVTEGSAVRGVRFRSAEGEWTAASRLVVGADGVESLVGRWAKLSPAWKPREIYSCYEARIRSARRCDNVLEFYFGNDVAPGGYGWAFPRGGNVWNVGVGIEPERARRVPARHFAEKLLERFDPSHEVLEWMGGAAGRAPSLPRMHGDGVVLAGDAARQANPLTGGGIMNALEGGDLAARFAGRALRGTDGLAGALRSYQREWSRRVSRKNDRYLVLADILYRYDDDELESLVLKVAAMLDRQREKPNPVRFVRDLLRLPRPLLTAGLMVIPANWRAIY